MTVHSIDGVELLTSLERIEKLAKERKDTVFNNIGHCISIANLTDAYHNLDGSKAVGMDGITKEKYGKNLYRNLEDLIQRIRKGSYMPKPARLVEIPKEDGSTRPLAISCFEDKIVQEMVNRILTLIYEPVFLPCSFGFREERGCHDALKALRKHLHEMYDGALVEIDIRKCFNSIPHQPLIEIIGRKISDGRFLKLTEKLICTPIIKDGRITENRVGCPQGSIISPILSNIYLHHVIDEWFDSIGKTHLKGKTRMVRYADDMVFVFEKYEEAERFYRVLGKRLNKYGLELHGTKSQILKSGSLSARHAEEKGKRLGVFKFLGFVCYWGKSANGKWRVKFKSRGDRLNAKLKGLREYLRENLNTWDVPVMLRRILRVVVGWLNYHAVSDNQRCVHSFLHKCR